MYPAHVFICEISKLGIHNIIQLYIMYAEKEIWEGVEWDGFLQDLPLLLQCTHTYKLVELKPLQL